MADIVMFGTGEGARLATRYFAEQGLHNIVAYVVDNNHRVEKRFLEAETITLGELASRFPSNEVKIFVALGFRGMNGLRAAKYTEIKEMGYSFASYIDPSNKLPAETVIGENCFILANQSIDRDVVIGNNVTMWSGCHVGDRSRIGNHVWMSSHVCLNGDVVIDSRCFLASNCCISPNIKLAERSFIGANALITADTSSGAVHVVSSTPAHPIADSERFMMMLRMS